MTTASAVATTRHLSRPSASATPASRHPPLLPQLALLVATLATPGLATPALAVPSPAVARDAEIRGGIDAVFAEWNRWDTPGAAVVVVRDGEVFYQRGYGSAQLEYSIPITPSTVFHVASVSKQFTAMAIELLARDGKLSWNDEVHRYLPELPDYGVPITLRQLGNHSSGLRDQWELLAMAGWRLDDVITREHILEMAFRQRELNFPPGAEHLYCNTGSSFDAGGAAQKVVDAVIGDRLAPPPPATAPAGVENAAGRPTVEVSAKELGEYPGAYQLSAIGALVTIELSHEWRSRATATVA